METTVILSGRSSSCEDNGTTVHQHTSGGGTTAACDDVLATIQMETEKMLANVDDNESGARGNSGHTEKVGGEREDEDVGNEGPHSGCIVKDANVTKTMAGDRYPYDVNWVPGRVQPGIVGGVDCFAFKMCMRLRDPLGVPFQLTFMDGLLRHIQYAGDDDGRAAINPQQTAQQQQDISHFSSEVDAPETTHDGGCSHAQPDDGDTPVEHVTGREEKKKKQCTSRPPRHPRSPTKAKGKEKVVPRRGETPKAAAAPAPKRRRRPGMAALAEIRQLQRSTNLYIALRPFMRVVGEIVETDIALGESMRFQMSAIRALMEAAEAYLINHFEKTNIIAIHCKRVTIQLKDLRLVDNLSKARWEYRYQGITDEQKRAEKLRQMNAARQEERDARAGKGLSGKTDRAT
ncbi:hypothetical protein CBR_g20344 [Chara braunii]|uniref:Core Histone H2A/H2B/H3 domain-containing protein n=1 Tax=Chara braunii TaxID=69332 RepID=A0A388L0B9_CHABU|nr:hypothetical protein CBR_g20344 [Chara braunii]|eukprot:GBG75721.1 hypothetical protein CBR_g20344 [Chara braunii]